MNVFNFDFQEWIQFIQKVGSGVTPSIIGLQLRFEAEVNIGSFGTWSAVC
jgi:hypothetical protein